MDAPNPPKSTKKKATAKPRTEGRDRRGGDDTKAEVAERNEIPKTKFITLMRCKSGNTQADTAQAICVPRLVVGLRMSMLQMEEYLGICGIIPKRTDYPEEDPDLKYRIHDAYWDKGELDAKLYGNKPAFEGLSHVQVLHHIAATFDMNEKSNNRFGAIIDNKDYIYVGIIPNPHAHIGENTDMNRFLEYTYREAIELDIMALERIQRIMYRIPIDDNLLDSSQKKTLSDIRNGKLEKLPHFYIVERPAEVLRLWPLKVAHE